MLEIVIGALIIVYNLFYLAGGWGANFGLYFLTALGAFFLIDGLIEKKVFLLKETRYYKLGRKFAILALILILVPVFLAEVFIIYNAQGSDRSNLKYCIVLGAGIKGEEISPALKERLDTAYKYYLDNKNTTFILSGGQGNRENVSEALAMRRYLLSRGVESEKLIEENASTSTYENIKYSRMKILAREYSLKNISIGIITNDFHIYRAKMLAKRQGIEADGIAARTPLSALPICYAREALAVIKTWLLG